MSTIRWRHARDRFAALFAEREIYVRSGGRVRFLRISRTAQVRAAALCALVLGTWLAGTAVMTATQLWRANAAAAVEAQRATLTRDAAAVARFRDRNGALVDDLARRQQLIERLVTSRLGGDAPAPAPTARTISALPDRAALEALAAGQDGFALRLAGRFEADGTALSERLRRLGLDPARMAQPAAARGGPLLPIPLGPHGMTPALTRLVGAVERWNVLNDSLAALPGALPTDGQAITSSYGVRSDPITGGPAFHAGMDFIGTRGQPIRASAAGRVVFAGRHAGYGNVVEIDHGNGVTSRYAHLSSLAVRVGQPLVRGQLVGGMGSTGRSTGTHLHFEVRIGGAAVNPRRFLNREQANAG